MKQAVIAGPKTFEIRDVEQPQPGAGEVLVRVRNVGVCGSDLHFYRGEFPLPPNFCLGHECSGEVAALGDGVTGFAPGDRVALELFKVCLVCPQCRSGNYHLCPSRKANGLTIPGGLCEYMAVPSYALYKLPPEVDFELGALVEPLAVAVHGIKLVDLKFGERVAVLGAGTIGLMTLAVAKALGASYIGVTARHPHQKAMAEALGADAVFSDEPAGVAALNVVAVGGRISVLGAFTAPVQIHPIMFFLKEARVVGSNCYGRAGRQSDYEIAIEIMRRNAESLRRAITHRFALEDVAQAYATADDKSSGAIKVTITP